MAPGVFSMPLTAMLCNLVSFTFIVISLQNTHYDPGVVIFSFGFMACARFFTVEMLMGLNRFGPDGLKKVLPYLCSPPHPGQKPDLVRDSRTNKPTGDWGYYFMVLIPLLVIFGAISKSEGLVPIEIYRSRLEWSLIYMGFYWVQDLLSRAVIVDFHKERITNLAYNMHAPMILFATVFISGFLMVFSQKFGYPLSPWIFCAILLALKHGSDFYLSMLKHRRKPLPKWLGK